jgi:hypothetical protein
LFQTSALSLGSTFFVITKPLHLRDLIISRRYYWSWGHEQPVRSQQLTFSLDLNWDSAIKGNAKTASWCQWHPLEGAIKVEDDDNFRGAILLLRNPVDAILSSFNAFYALQYHYLIDLRAPAEDQFRAPVEDWIRYRDSAQFAAQVKLYEKFVIHWMNKYKKNREDLLLITYEGLTGRRGEIFTKQIANSKLSR